MSEEKYENTGEHVFLTSWTVGGRLVPTARALLTQVATNPEATLSSNKNGSIVAHFPDKDVMRAEAADEIHKQYRKIRSRTKELLDDYADLDTKEQWAEATNAAYQQLHSK